MTIETETADVVFLKDYNTNNVFAIFPGIAATETLMTCYAHVGQHSSAAFRYCDECIEVTDPTGYADLATELSRIGYNLRVVHKARMHDAEYADARRSEFQI